MVFRKGCSCADAILSLKQILEKRRDFNLSTYLLFLDYKKAYNSVDSSKLRFILENYDVQQNLINATKSLHKNTEICIKISDTKISEPVTVNVGLHHGCGLSPVLFNIDCDSDSVIEIEEPKRDKKVDYVQLSGSGESKKKVKNCSVAENSTGGNSDSEEGSSGYFKKKKKYKEKSRV
jgi:hypothetical protein